MKKGVLSVILLLIAVNLTISFIHLNKNHKVAFIRSQELVNQYAGMQEMRSHFEQQTQQWQTEIDTMKSAYQKTLVAYQNERAQFGTAEKEKREQALQIQKEQLIRYVQSVESRSKQQEEELLEGVLNQVNSFVEAYGKDQGFDIIFGTTLSGSLLYGKQAMDITDEVLEAMNEQYRG